MVISKLKICISGLFFAFILFSCGCQESNQPNTAKAISDSNTPEQVKRVSDYVTMGGYGRVRVRGYGLVVGLSGTGSSECPPDIRLYLQKYINSKIGKSNITANELIDSKDTAVVTVFGLLPEGSIKDERFDLVISSLAGTQTTSLRGGRLLESDLKRSDAVASTAAIATGEGAIFTDWNKDQRIGYVLNGGKSLIIQDVSLNMKKPDFVQASIIRDRINEKFGLMTAVAENENVIKLKIPAKYYNNKVHFLNLVGALYIAPSAQEYNKKMQSLISDFAEQKNLDITEIALEAIGKNSADYLVKFLKSPNEELRFRSARCLLNMSDMRGYETLTEIALSGSIYKSQAIDAIAYTAPKRDATVFLQQFLYSPDFNLMFKTYQHLSRFDDVAISIKTVQTRAGRFDIERIVRSGNKVIWAARSGEPKVVFFGAPIYCLSGIFIESPDQRIIATAEPESDVITLIYKDPKSGKVETMKSSLEAGLVLRTLCQETITKKGKVIQKGLGVPYSMGVEFFKTMCEKGAIDAAFVLGDEPEVMKSINENI
jgi:hypothetical protein